MSSEPAPMAVVGTRRTMRELVDGTLRVQIDIDPQHRSEFLQQFSEIDVAVGLVRLNLKPGDQPALPSMPSKKDGKPYGHEASELFKRGFFFNPAVLKAIGTDAEFLEWIRQQPCAMTGEFDRNEDGHGNFIERCEAAHVRRIANGAGTSEKPPYSAIPLAHLWHDAQTQDGERVFHSGDPRRPNRGGDPIKGREWMEKKRNEYVVEWASHKLAETLGVTSMGHVEPNILFEWADAHGLQAFLPAAYK